MAILLNRNLSKFANTKVLNVKDLFSAKKMNFSKSTYYDGEVLNGLLDWDRTDLNDMGYKIMTYKSALSLSIYHYTGRKVGTKPSAKSAKPSRHRQRTLAKQHSE